MDNEVSALKAHIDAIVPTLATKADIEIFGAGRGASAAGTGVAASAEQSADRDLSIAAAVQVKSPVRGNAVKLSWNFTSSFPRKRESIGRLPGKRSMDSRLRGNDVANLTALP
ncbi:hypothetical protein GTP55_06190 [Duganella sp. FT109W]|uniref:Uncharacterized protein n=1 Tax=Duganella margarita TaxID=2692170 RepID=A0ABW9WEN5_9BURK|nr:hypothetical protein [Duganella margarita]MYN38958.1 hypothetical protein [Duganella margarita]